MNLYLRATDIIDSDNHAIIDKAKEVTEPCKTDIEKAVALFYFVRDRIKYNPFMPRFLSEHFRASNTLERKTGFCVQKATLLVALSRAVKISSRLRFAVLRNHLLPDALAKILKGKELPDHGFAELYIDGRWVKANVSFDIGTCRDFIIPVEFDGRNDALFHSHTRDNRLHIEYVCFRDSYRDVPVEKIIEWVEPVLMPDAKRSILGC